MSASPVSDAEIEAYLDGELELERRLAVEDHLARRPDAAARLMAEMRGRTALRLLAAETDPMPGEIRASGALLARRLGGRQGFRFAGPLAAMAAGAVLAVLAPLAVVGPTSDRPSYVEDAVTSYQTGLLRAAMVSQIESPTFDAKELQASTRISVPPLPDGWTITDVQVFPSDEGPAVQIMIDTDAHSRVSLFAVHAPSTAPVSPAAVRHGATSVAFWQADGVSYALTGTESPEALDRSAESVAAQLVTPAVVPAVRSPRGNG
ncbi:anti-sigma factor family protein [Aureimonas leprariae]|uniref:anti-sigma factor family protein n=1 Tax=Plantimonas leprariae TaxID=2615207 RepID=UPI00192A56D4|nr:hypothetical protein [Aureimonas leprariae]